MVLVFFLEEGVNIICYSVVRGIKVCVICCNCCDTGMKMPLTRPAPHYACTCSGCSLGSGLTGVTAPRALGRRQLNHPPLTSPSSSVSPRPDTDSGYDYSMGGYGDMR